jgi:predicted nucleic acid-binding Zn ribbon protein
MRMRQLICENVCQNCGEPFPVKARHALTCSDRCRKQLSRLRAKTVSARVRALLKKEPWRNPIRPVQVEQED